MVENSMHSGPGNIDETITGNNIKESRRLMRK